MAQPIRVSYWPTPNTIKVTIALEEMGLAYVLEPLNIRAGEQVKPEFLKISPNGRVPAIVDPEGPDGSPISVFESGAILKYLANKTGRFQGADARAAVAVDEWLFWQMGGLGPMLGQATHFRFAAPPNFPDQRHLAYSVNRYSNEARRLAGVMNVRLEGRDYLADDYSIADMACWGWIDAAPYTGLTLNDFRNLEAWHARVKAREGTQRALAKADDFRRAHGL